MAMTPLPTGVGGTLFAGGGGMGGSEPANSPGAVHAPSLGKNSVQQNLASPHSGLRSSITKGDPMSRLMGQYGKGHSFGNMMGGVPGGGNAASPLHQIRGGIGQMKRIRGGLGPGKVGQAGASNTDYSMTSGDTE
jgi:hypothetical protein